MQVLYGNVFIPKTNNSVGAVIPNKGAANTAAQSFESILSKKSEEIETLQFSKHAEMRLKSRDINLSNEQLKRALDGVNRAKSKGIKDSLVLVDDVALVINTKSNVVITALEGKNESVFTNIDGAVIV